MNYLGASGKSTNATMSLSDAIKTSANNMLFETLLTNPHKRAQVLELLTQEGIVGSDENSSPNSAKSKKYNTPIKRLYKNDNVVNKSPNVRLESPSALCRRRALQRLESDSSVEEPPAKQPSPPFVGTPKPFERLLEGVVAYCEIRSDGKDRSSAIKTMMQTMGAKVKDNLCKGVTHVVLKDGLYTTYRKAKFLKVHVVSVLWLEAVRRHMFRVPEEKFPAVCADASEADLSKICQEIQNDYNEVIQDELNKTNQHENENHIEFPVNFITERKKTAKSRATIQGTDFSYYKQPHNRTEIASPYKYKCYEPEIELSETDSYVSVGSISNKSVDIVPSSQNVVVSLPSQAKKSDLNKISEEDANNDFPESNLAKLAKNSFELEKASKIRSPESLNRSRQKNATDNIDRISFENEESLRLHVSTTDDSNCNSTRNSKSKTDSLKNNLETSINQKTMSSGSGSLNLHLSDDSNSIHSEKNENIKENMPEKNKIRRTNVGLKRPAKNISKSKSEDVISKSLEISPKNLESKRKTRRQTVFAINDSKRKKSLTNITEIENENDVTDDKTKSDLEIEYPIKTRRKSLANIFAANKTNPEETENESNDNQTKNSLEIKENSGKKVRRKSLANIFEGNESQNNKIEPKKTKRRTQIVEENKDKQVTRKSVKNKEENKEIQQNEKKNELNSPNKTKRRVRKLYDPKQNISASNINWEDEQECQIIPTETQKTKYKVPLNVLPKILSARAENKIKSISKSTKSVPPKLTKIIENDKKKSARVLNFDSSSSDDVIKPKVVHLPSRRSERIAKTPKKKSPESDSDNSQNSNNNLKTPLKKKIPSEEHTPSKRRSTFDFLPKKSSQELKSTQKSKNLRLPGITCTRFHRADEQIFRQIVKKLGGFVIEDEVTKRTTHLIAGEPIRTINMLRAIVGGCWVLRKEWLYKSLEAGKWVEEEDFEMTEFSPTVQKKCFIKNSLLKYKEDT